jgi:hypothetical protein
MDGGRGNESKALMTKVLVREVAGMITMVMSHCEDARGADRHIIYKAGGYQVRMRLAEGSRRDKGNDMDPFRVLMGAFLCFENLDKMEALLCLAYRYGRLARVSRITSTGKKCGAKDSGQLCSRVCGRQTVRRSEDFIQIGCNTAPVSDIWSGSLADAEPSNKLG